MPTLSSSEIRQALISRIATFCEASGMSKSEVGRRALNDVSFVSGLEGDRNITFETYERVRTWLDKHEANGKRRAS